MYTESAPRPPGLIRVRDARDLLSVVPHLLGYQPQDSLLLISVRPGGEIGLMARVDLGPLNEAQDRSGIYQLLAKRTCEDRAEAALVIAYTSGPCEPSGAAGTYARELRDLMRRLLDSAEAWLVGSETFRCLDCEDGDPCPPAGHPITELDCTVPQAEMIMGGANPAPSRAEYGRLTPATPGCRKTANAAARRVRRGKTSHPDRLADWRVLLSKARRGVHLPAATIGRLAGALDEDVFRDAIFLWLTPGQQALAKAWTRGASGGEASRETLGEEIGRALEGVLSGNESRPPDQAAVSDARTVLEAVVAHQSLEEAAPALTLLSYLAWLCGQGALANLRIEAALAANPRYRLATLLDRMLQAGLPPGWVRVQYT